MTGYETRDELNANSGLKQRIESIRLQAGPAMKLGDVDEESGAEDVPGCAGRPPAATSTRAPSFRTTATRRSACWAR